MIGNFEASLVMMVESQHGCGWYVAAPCADGEVHDRPLYAGGSMMVDSQPDAVGTLPPPVRVRQCTIGPFIQVAR